MLYPIRIFLSALYLLLLVFALSGCDTGAQEVRAEFINHKFDQQVIDKLPLYDSLVAAIIKNFPSFKKYIRDEDSYRSFRYMPASEDNDVFIKLPPAAAPNIDPVYARLGKDFIYGFEIFKDSSVKINVRNRFSSKLKVDTWENLSYYPTGNFRKRKFPEKDTVLDKNWQYWVRFDKRGVF
ncbi:MAG: hypothetical protein ABIO79_07480 [Ferruginibacter sp.]